jgi:hypothetical protein
VSGTLPIANGGTNATTAAAALTNLGAYPATNPNGYITSSGSITGNAATATALQTARTIGGVSFNGTANINLPGVNTAGNQNTSGNATTATSLTSSNFISQTGSTGSWNSDFQNTPAGTAKYGGDVGANGTNGPGGSWWIQQNFRHTNGGNFWGTQVAWGWEDNANRLATRNVQNGSFGGWVYYLNSANFTSYAPSLTGSGASGTWGIAITGNAGTATTLTSSQSSWGTGVIGNVVGLLAWKNYGNGHVIFDASQSTTPSGGTTSNSDPLAYWSPSYPTLMGWNGSSTYGVRVDRARLADQATATPNALALAGGTMTGNIGMNDQRLYLRTNGDTNHYLWNAGDDWEELVAYFGTGFRVQASNGQTLKTYATGGNQSYVQETQRYAAPSGTFPVIIGNASGFPADRGIILQSSSGSSIPLYFTVSSGATVSGSVIASGGSTAYNTSSDYRMKENIRDLDVLAAVNKIMSIRPRVFDWKEECGGKKNSVGFIAHELQEYAPECVDGEKDRVHSDGAIFPQGVDSSWLIPSISTMLQEHQKVIEHLKAEVAALKGI